MQLLLHSTIPFLALPLLSLLLVSSVAVTAAQVTPFRFLVLTFHDTGSHQKSTSKLFLELAARGHHVTVLDTTSKQAPDFGANVEVVHAPVRWDPYREKNVSLGALQWRSMTSVDKLPLIYSVNDGVLGKLMEQHPEAVLKLLREEFDAVLLDDLFAVHGIWVAELLQRHRQVPFVLYATTDSFVATGMARARHRHPLLRPGVSGPLAETAADVYSPKRFWHRLSLFMGKMSEVVALEYVVPFFMPTFFDFGIRDFSYHDHLRDGKFLFCESFDRLGLAEPETHDFLGTGPDCPSVGRLSGDLARFLEDPNSKGTIFVAFGCQWSFAPEYALTAFFEALARFADYRVVFAFNGTPRPVPAHVRLERWAPQREILHHPSTKVFLSHSGLKSTNEALCAGVPLAVMPFFAEQRYNSEYLVRLGLATYLNKYLLTPDSVETAIRTVLLEHEVRKHRMERVRALYTDRPAPPLRTAAFYVERVARAARNASVRVTFPRHAVAMHWPEFLGLDWLLLVATAVIVCSSQ